MIQYKTGDILRADVEAIINTVNCVGVMGRGIALQFKKAWPGNYSAYEAACKNKQVIPGKMFVYDTQQLTNPRFIINFPTKRHWRSSSHMADIESGLVALVEEIKSRHIKSVAIPALGCGLGGLHWPDVKTKIETAMQTLTDVDVQVFEPQGAPASEQMAKSQVVPPMTAGRAVLIELMSRYLDGLLDPMVSLLEVHKLLYLMQSLGEPLRLHYQKALYGPYAENLRHVLNQLEGHYISGYADGGDQPNKSLKLLPGAIEQAKACLQEHPETQYRFDKVVELVNGFESSFGLELLTTVHWVMTNENIRDYDKICQAVYNWNEHKKMFTPRQIGLAVDILKQKGWIN